MLLGSWKLFLKSAETVTFRERDSHPQYDLNQPKPEVNQLSSPTNL
jgi:hypothetical protein